MNEYPKKVKLSDTSLKNLLAEKQRLINTGIETSKKIENYEKGMEEIDKKIQAYEATVDISDLGEKAKVITEEVNVAIAKMEVVKKEIYDRMKKDAPADLYIQYEALKKVKDDAEAERNKLALKAQKYTDKIIPIARRLMSPHLTNEYCDYGSLSLEDGEVVATIINHREEWETNFKNRSTNVRGDNKRRIPAA